MAIIMNRDLFSGTICQCGVRFALAFWFSW